MWRRSIREKWKNRCAYCESEDNLTLDHIVPQSKGGSDTTRNVVACCHSCNQSKGHTPWEEWYYNQDFFSYDNYEKIKNWMKPEAPTNLYAYRPRRNNAS
jgi:5-methylcytosine-specific restriction endonuclease McrA